MAYNSGTRRYYRSSLTDRTRPLSVISSTYSTVHASTESTSHYRTRHVSESSDSSTEAPEDPYGHDDELVPVQFFKKLLECPVCLEYLKAPVHQCWEGHLLCKRCFKGKKLSQCPICRGSLFQNRNLAVEDVLNVLRNPDNRQKIQDRPASPPPNPDSLSGITKEDLVSIISNCVKTEVAASLNEFKEGVNTALQNLEKKVIDKITDLESEDEDENFDKILQSCAEISKKASMQNEMIVKGLGEMCNAICEKFEKQEDRIDEVKTDLERHFVSNVQYSKNSERVENSFKSLDDKMSLTLKILAGVKGDVNQADSNPAEHGIKLQNGHCNGVESHLENGYTNEDEAKAKEFVKTEENEVRPKADPMKPRAPSEPKQEVYQQLPLRKIKSDTDSKPASRGDLHSILSQIVNKLSRAIESRESIEESQPDGSQSKKEERAPSLEKHESRSEDSETESESSDTVAVHVPPPTSLARTGPLLSSILRVRTTSQNTSESDAEYFDPEVPGPSGYIRPIPESLPCPLHYQSSCTIPHTDTRSHLISLWNFSPWGAENGRWEYQSRNLLTRHNVVIVENLGRWFQVAYNQVVTADSELCCFLQVRLVSDKPDNAYDFFVDISLFKPGKDGFYGSIQHEVKPFWTEKPPHLLNNMDYMFMIDEDYLDEYRREGGILFYQIEFLAVEKEVEE